MKILYFLICIFAFVVRANSQNSRADFQYGPRPKSSVFDPKDTLTKEQITQISEPLARIRQVENIDVIVVILPDIGDAPPELIARTLADNWSLSKINAVVLHVPGREGSPWIVPGEAMTRLIRPEAMQAAISSAQIRAAAEPTDGGKVRAASMEAADALRYWAGGAVLVSEQILNDRLDRQLAFEKRQRLLKLAALMGAAASIPLIVGLVFLFLKLKNTGSRHFPETRKIPRLGAPYAGGNHAVSNIK